MAYLNKCRTCLGSSKEMRNLNATITIGGDDVSLLSILETFYHFSVSSEENLPQEICINCVHQLTITYSFKILIESTQKTLSNVSDAIDSPDDDTVNDCDYEPDDKSYLYNQKEDREDVEERPEKPNRFSIKIRKNAKKSLYCVECRKKFGKVGPLYEHYQKNHPVKSTVGRACDYCCERFEDFRSLVIHKKKHLRPYVCEKCWQGFFDMEDMDNHLCKPRLTKEEKKKIDRVLRQCDQCGKSYPPTYIKIHMRTHSDDRPYHCKLCPKKFKVLGGLHSHIQWNHRRTRNHRCEICNATFISSSSRSTHIRKNHLKEKKYPCKCGKRFFSKSELERHNLTHTGVKNFHCHLCDKSYQTRYGLNVHLKSHSQMNVLSL